MTLANMRAQGVRSLWVVCELCRHEAVLNVDCCGDAVSVPALPMGSRPRQLTCRGQLTINDTVRRRTTTDNYDATPGH